MCVCGGGGVVHGVRAGFMSGGFSFLGVLQLYGKGHALTLVKDVILIWLTGFSDITCVMGVWGQGKDRVQQHSVDCI